MDCLFCKIVNGEIPSTKVYEDEFVYAFRDIQPQAPVHVIVIPKAHIASSANDINAENCDVIGKLFFAIPKIAAAEGLTRGYRIVNNCGKDACQSVQHIHFHILGGRKLADHMA